MAAFEQKTVVRSYKLRIKDKFKRIAGETDKIVTLLQSCVSSFKDEVDTLLVNNDERFFSLYENLTKDFETYSEKLYLLEASLEKNPEDDEITQIEEEHSETAYSNHQHEPIPFSNKDSSQTFCKTFYSSGDSAATSFFSLQEDCRVTQPNLPQLQNSVESEARSNNEKADLYFPWAQDASNTVPKYSEDSHVLNPESHLSSESSRYQSFSSAATSLSANHPESKFVETRESEICGTFHPSQYGQATTGPVMPHPLISVPSNIRATLSHIVTPDDFWMKFEDSRELLSFEDAEFGMKPFTLCVQPGYFCLALSNKVNMYLRAKVLTKISVNEEVEVFFIDFGSTHTVPVKNLRVLPDAAYHLPMRVFHCGLSDVLPIDGAWSSQSIHKFKESRVSHEIRVNSYSSGKYGIELTIETLMGWSISVSEVLCQGGFAVKKEELSPSLLADKTSVQQVSHDSGVCVTSNLRLWFSSEMLDCDGSSYLPLPPLQKKTYPQSQITEIQPMGDYASSKSSERFSELTNKENNDNSCANRAEGDISCENGGKGDLCVSKCSDDCNCPLHLVVPPPILHFVEERRMLVMLSSIVSPSEFYVNPAMEDNITLDELLEKMTAFYEFNYQDCQIGVGDLKVGRFLAGRFSEDNSWYRVKILDDYLEDAEGIYVTVQYTDYGNKAAIRCSDLRPLKPEFVLHPSFAVECSLAGIVPLVSTIEKEFSPWDKAAVEAFHQLANFDRCLTAEIVGNSVLPQPSETVPVLLWDTKETHDILINEALVSKGVAAFHPSLISTASNENKDLDVLSTWDPMGQEFDDIENSYGVDVDDIGVRISGYKPKDDSRICKYFALHNGYCRNGNNCSREHVYLPEGGVTRDQEEAYSLDTIPSLPASSTHVLVQVSAVINPGRFYAILPFGNRTVDEIDSMVNRGFQPVSWQNNEVVALFRELTEYYSNLPFTENTTVALSFGTIVVAWRNVDSAWHRARVINISDIQGPVQVFFVDFGDDDWVPRKKIREVLPQYLHTPFQAIECHLSDIEPLGFEKGKSWSIHSINYFSEMVSEAILLAHITSRCGKVLHLTLRNTKPGDHDFVSERLISAGFAQQCTLSISKGKECNYAPG